MGFDLDCADIRRAAERIAPYVRHTRLLAADTLGEKLGCRLFIKPECFQYTHSFKVRGALNKVLSVRESRELRGIVASSAGNHGIACAWVGKKFGYPVKLVLPENAPEMKAQGAKELGAEVTLCGFLSSERWAKAYEIAEETGYTVVHSFNDPEVMAGQGTMALEILDELPDIDTLVVPIGAGGMISGVSAAIKAISPATRIVGVEPEAVCKFTQSRRAGRPVSLPPADTLADGLELNVAFDGPFSLIERYVDDIVTVTEDEIRDGVNELASCEKLVAEPSGAVGAAALLAGKIGVSAGETVCFIATGGNWGMKQLSGIYAGAGN